MCSQCKEGVLQKDQSRLPESRNRLAVVLGEELQTCQGSLVPVAAIQSSENPVAAPEWHQNAMGACR